MCFNHIDIFTHSLWHMNKVNYKIIIQQRKRKVLAASAQNKRGLVTSNSVQNINGKCFLLYKSSVKSQLTHSLLPNICYNLSF